MPISKLGLWLSLISSATIALWFNQDSIETYWQQQYHRPSPLATLQQYTWWQQGSHWRNALLSKQQDNKALTNNTLNASIEIPSTQAESNEALDIEPSSAETTTPPLILESLNTQHDATTQEALNIEPSSAPSSADNTNQTALATEETLSAQNTVPIETIAAQSTPSEALNTAQINADTLPEKIILHAGDQVLFIGDSMMQSFAPHMQKWLKNQYQINSNNLGRHSTGLTNQEYYDWPLEAEKRFANTQKLKLVVVMMGANDAWNIETASKHILNFKTPEWAAEYGARALRIVNAAKQQNAQVIWIGLPHMRLNKYNPKIRFLDNTLAQQLSGKAIYIPSHQLLDDGSGGYKDSIEKDGKLVRVRHKDGIHLNAQGELIILDAIKPYLEFSQ